MKRILRVFVIGAEPDLGKSLSDHILKSGHQPVLRAHATVQEIREEAPDLLLLALQGGEEAGLDLLRRMVRHHLTGRTPVIVLSDRSELEYELIDAYDFLPPAANPQRLKEGLTLLAAHPAAAEGSYPPLRGETARPFQEFLAEHAGLHFDARNMRMLERGLHRRMRAVQSKDYAAYFHYLESYYEGRGELKKLLSLLTVGETYFFRYRSDREALIQHVIPELIRRRSAERRLFIWSAGCSTGEEPYSIAILLLAHFPQLANWQIEILATDINKRSLQKARQGIYREHSLRLTAGHYRERFFSPTEGDLYQLDPRVRSMVHFAYQNLQGTEFSACSGGKQPDIIFCRNVLIYFRRETFVRIIERFHKCLPPDGYLFLGHAENLAGMSHFFQPVHQHGTFFYQPANRSEKRRKVIENTPLPARQAPPATVKIPFPAQAIPAPAPHKEPVNLSPLLEKARLALNREEFASAENFYGEILHHAPDHLEALIGQGMIKANQGEYAAARRLCDRAIHINDLYPEAYFLRGQICEMEGLLAAAEGEYKKVLWLQIDFIAARYALARIEERQQKTEPAIREFRSVLRQLEKLPAEAVVPHSGGLTREVFLEICREDLSRISPSLAITSV